MKRERFLGKKIIKQSPGTCPGSAKPKPKSLHHAARSAALFAILLVRCELVDGRKADEDIHEPFDYRPRAENQIDDIPITAEEASQSDEAPVEGADDDEDPGNHVKFHRNIGVD